MAALHYTTTITTSLNKFNSQKSSVIVSCFHASFPTKPTKRKNYLRQKILKTLPKSLIPKLPPSNPTTIESPNFQEITEPEFIQEIEELEKSENEELQKSQELKEVEVSLLHVGVLAKNPILKYGLWLVGAFVFQTVCAVWVFGSADFDNKSEILNENEKNSVIEVRGNGKGKSMMGVGFNANLKGQMGVRNGGFLYVDELEMATKIEEIRVMAREAREKERLESKKDGFGDEENDEIDEGKYSRSGIEEEVDNRLIKLRKKLENVRDSKPVLPVGFLRKGELDEGVGDEALLFKKKYKFKGVLNDTREKPKGFVGSDDNSISKHNKSGSREEEDELFGSQNADKGAVDLRDGDKQPEPSDDDSKGSDAVNVTEDDQAKGMAEVTKSTKNSRKKVPVERGKKKQGGKAVAKPTMTNGIALEKSNGRSVIEAVESRNQNAGIVKTRESSGMNSAVVSDKLSNGNDSLKGKRVGDAKLAKKRESETDFWWLNLRYVLAILMRRSHNGEGGEGLYTLKSTSSEEGRISHTVAFEDRVDATNFCYLLQSFFEDLEDFEADVVPLTVKELNEAVKSHTKKVIVVKKGQLRLYAGQPLADAEMALRALLQQV